MGIENRDYYREERAGYTWEDGPRGAGWSAVTWIIVITIGVFILQLLLGPAFERRFALIPEAVRRGAVWQLLTYAFLHDQRNIWHIVFNLWVFHMAGRDFEARRGSKELVVFYLLAAIVSGVAVLIWETLLGRGAPALGASGAVSAVLMEYAFANPRAKILLFGVLPMTMMTFAVGVLLFDSVPMLLEIFGRGSPDDRIAHSAHLGGLLFGILYQQSGWRVTGWLPEWTRVRKLFRRQPSLRVHRPAEPEPDFGPDFESRVDALLDKVARSGESSLTTEEREVLMEASRRARNRRSQ